MREKNSAKYLPSFYHYTNPPSYMKYTDLKSAAPVQIALFIWNNIFVIDNGSGVLYHKHA